MNNDIAELELNIETAKELMQQRDALLRLNDNHDFKKIIAKGYFEDEAIRLAHCTADPNQKNHRDEIMISLQAISVLKQHLHYIIVMGNNAEQAMLEAEETLDEIRAEGGEV